MSKICPATVRKDLMCVLGRIFQITDSPAMMFWGTCPKCVKATGGKK